MMDAGYLQMQLTKVFSAMSTVSTIVLSWRVIACNPFIRGASSEVQCTTLGFGHNLFNNLLNKIITAQSIILIKRQLCYCIVQQWSLKMWPLFTYVMYTILYNSCRFHLMFMSLLRSITCGHCNIKQVHVLNWVTVDTTCPPLPRLSSSWN